MSKKSLLSLVSPILVGMALCCPAWSEEVGADSLEGSCLPALAPVGSSWSPVPQYLAATKRSAHSQRMQKDGQPIFTQEEKVAVGDLRLASCWLASAYDVPVRVPEEMLLAGYSYSDCMVALSLMDHGASLNEVLEQRASHRWVEVARNVNISIMDLPLVVRRLMVSARNNVQGGTVHFVPDVRSGLASRLRLPSFSPTLPDDVSILRFKVSEQEVKDIRYAFANSNHLTQEMLEKSAGDSLIVADWIIAGTIAKYKPFAIDTILRSRTGQVVDWGDIAGIYSLNPSIFSSGPLASAYCVVCRVAAPGVVPTTLFRGSYPEGLVKGYTFEDLTAEESSALRWLASMYYKESSAENSLLESTGFSLGEKALALALSRISMMDLSNIVAQRRSGMSWKAFVDKYSLDMTGEDGLKACLETRMLFMPVQKKAETETQNTESAITEA